jgi:hypothetical protein
LYGFGGVGPSGVRLNFDELARSEGGEGNWEREPREWAAGGGGQAQGAGQGEGEGGAWGERQTDGEASAAWQFVSDPEKEMAILDKLMDLQRHNSEFGQRVEEEEKVGGWYGVLQPGAWRRASCLTCGLGLDRSWRTWTASFIRRRA